MGWGEKKGREIPGLLSLAITKQNNFLIKDQNQTLLIFFPTFRAQRETNQKKT